MRGSQIIASLYIKMLQHTHTHTHTRTHTHTCTHKHTYTHTHTRTHTHIHTQSIIKGRAPYLPMGYCVVGTGAHPVGRSTY
jgi:hypothetical protein